MNEPCPTAGLHLRLEETLALPAFSHALLVPCTESRCLPLSCTAVPGVCVLNWAHDLVLQMLHASEPHTNDNVDALVVVFVTPAEIRGSLG